MPSLKWPATAWPSSRFTLVSLSQNSSVAPGSTESRISGSDGCVATISVSDSARSAGRSAEPDHDQVLRDQSCGSSQSVAGSGPRLTARSRIRMSSGPALAYSTNTSW